MASNSQIITLNVGGAKFRTTRETLCKFPDTMIGKMFDDNLPMHPSNLKDEEGNIFIDKNPDLFAEILDMCRQGKMDSDPSKKLKREMKYWFSLQTQKTEEELEAKKISESIHRCWARRSDTKTQCIEYCIPFIRYHYDGKNDSLSSEKFKQMLKENHEKCNKMVGEYGMQLADFCVWSNITKEQSEKVRHLTLEKEDDFYVALSLLDEDVELFKRVKTMWNDMSKYGEEFLSKPYVLETVCHNLQKKIGSQYKTLWYRRKHFCGRDGSDKWEKKKLKSSSLKASGEAYTSNMCLFPNIKRFENGSHETEFMGPSCQCGEDHIIYKEYGSRYICIYPIHKYSDVSDSQEKKLFKHINDGVEQITESITSNADRIIRSTDDISDSIQNIDVPQTELHELSQELSKIRTVLKRKYEDD